MSDSWLSTAIASAATLLGVGLGAWLTSFRETRTAKRIRGWNITDQQRTERRDIYVGFLLTCDQAIQQAWETGRKRTAIHKRKEKEQHFIDLTATSNEMLRHLTEVRLVAPSLIASLAEEVVICARVFGRQSLLAGEEEGMKTSAASHQRAYDKKVNALMDAIKEDLGLVHG